MKYEFLHSVIERDNVILPNSDKINPFLLKNNYADIIKGIDFIASEEKFLYVHGFMGTGKRQYINYLCEFIGKDVIKFEYYCKEATVCDDILISFLDIIDANLDKKIFGINAKVTALNVKFLKQIESLKKPCLIILHSFDDILEDNAKLIRNLLNDLLQKENVKLILSTRAMKPPVMGNLSEDRKIFLKALSKENFKEFLQSCRITATEQTIEDFYKYTRGYYYYLALSAKIIQAMKIQLIEFLQKFNQSGMTFDAYLGLTYVNIIPTTIRNFFWFLRTIRHGLTLNALATFELYDEFSIEYLKTNLMIFQVDETIYVQDYFLQDIDISIPEKTEIKLHKYIIGIYEGQLKAPLKERIINLSRQALRAEIEYHNAAILGLKQHNHSKKNTQITNEPAPEITNKQTNSVGNATITEQIKSALLLAENKQYTGAIETLINILDTDNIDLLSVVEIRLQLARLYKTINNYRMAAYYYELVETYYIQHKEHINLNYLYYEMTELYFNMYKNNRAVDTIKKVIYSVDTPQSLLVSACTLLGNIYSDMNNSQEAYSYYKKALDSLDENVSQETLADLYFKFALANDDRGELEQAIEYYNKCIAIGEHNQYKALAYSNLASCYADNDNYNEAKHCFRIAYDIEQANNNYDGVYYTASNLAQILLREGSDSALNFLIEAQKSAEFLNEEFYILESTIALGDYYYNDTTTYKNALKEYFKARNLAVRMPEGVEISKIENRIQDMKLRMRAEDFDKISKKYEQ